MTSVAARALVTIAAIAFAAASVRAQEMTGRVAVEAVVSASTTSEAADDPFLMFDLVSTVRLGGGWDAVFRPWARRMPGGDWGTELYQAQIRYTSSTRVPFRVDAGIIPSPLGLATLELKADRNPTIDAPFYYFVPLPPFDGHFDGVTLMSGGYPLGVVVTTSGERWDARGGVTDDTPARPRDVLHEPGTSHGPQLIAGGGITPVAGLRLGAGFARGRYRAAADAAPALNATVFNLEGEYAIGYTKISGEWIVDRFETTTIAPAVARGFNLEALRTLTPRWFAAARLVRASSPVLAGPLPGRRSAASAEATIGYRLTPQLTLRAGYQTSTRFGRPDWDHTAAASLVWAQRWW